MATASVAVYPGAAIAGPVRTSQRRVRAKCIVTGLNAFNGLKAHNSVASVGLPVCTEQYFAKIVSSLKGPKGGGGALTTTCSAVDEIFRIAAIMPALVLIGVAVGFVLLRIEASLEEE